MVKSCKIMQSYVTSVSQNNKMSSYRSNDESMFDGIGRKLRIEVGGKVVDVRIGRLVERVWVDVVG